MAAPNPFEIPRDVQAFAEKSVKQAKQAVDGLISAANQSMHALEGQAESARQGAKQATEKAMSFAEKNVAKSFDLVQQLVRATNVQEILRAQTNFIRSQLQGLTGQAKDLGENAEKTEKKADAPKV
jgi:phasin